MKFLKGLVVVIVVLAIAYLAGPTPDTPVYNTALPEVPTDLSSLESHVNAMEAEVPVKPDNQARIVWANDSLKQKTHFAILYLHGFSASQEEGDPIHERLAKEFGCNLYLARLSEHGLISDQPMAKMTATSLWNSAVEAYAIAKQLGDSVIVVSTSTGGTLSLMLCASFPEIHSQILMSPNIQIFNPTSKYLNDPWGKQIAQLVLGTDHIVTTDQRDIYKKYWYSKYPFDALPELEELLETSMTKENFNLVKQPTLLLYYYKDEHAQDSVVSVPAMKNMFKELGTPADLKFEQAIPNAGNHVIGGAIESQDIESVYMACEKFMSRITKKG